MDDGRWTVDDGRWTMDDGRWTMDDGRWTMDDGRWTVTLLFVKRTRRFNRNSFIPGTVLDCVSSLINQIGRDCVVVALSPWHS